MRPMRVATIIPVGPGHEKHVEQALDAILAASVPSGWEVIPLTFDDTRGENGRSAARNILVRTAIGEGADWIWVQDADDLASPGFLRGLEVATHVRPDLEALWGEVWTEKVYRGSDGEVQHTEPGRSVHCKTGLESYEDVMRWKPYNCFRVGNFFRPIVWEKVGGWREDWDIGEDHEWNYAAAFHARAFLKMARQLHLIRGCEPSAHGPRGYVHGDPHLDPTIAARMALVEDYWRARGPVPWTAEERKLRREGRLYDE